MPSYIGSLVALSEDRQVELASAPSWVLEHDPQSGLYGHGSRLIRTNGEWNDQVVWRTVNAFTVGGEVRRGTLVPARIHAGPAVEAVFAIPANQCVVTVPSDEVVVTGASCECIAAVVTIDMQPFAPFDVLLAVDFVATIGSVHISAVIVDSKP